MRLLSLVGAVVLLSAGLADASKIREFNFVEQAAQAYDVVVADELRLQNGTLRMTAKESLLGGIDGEVMVSILYPVHGGPPDRITGQRVIFLAHADGKYSLVGQGLQAIWPPGEGFGTTCLPAVSQPAAHGLLQLARQVRTCASTPSASECEEFVLMGLQGENAFARLVSTELCVYLRDKGASDAQHLVDLGATLATRSIGDNDPTLAYTSLELASEAPGSVTVPIWLKLAQAPETPAALRNALILKLASIAGRYGRNSPQDMEFSHSQRLHELEGWFAETSSDRLARDYQLVKDRLSSKRLGARMAGHAWLVAIAGDDFGYEASGTDQERTSAISRAGSWWSARMGK